MGSVRRSFFLALSCLWILTTGSTCQSSVESGHFQAQGNGAAVVLVVLVGAGVACLADLDDCGGREPTALDRAEMTFEAGLERLKRGDSSGLGWICLAGLQGNARAQYFYGVHLLREDPRNLAASLAWLKRAAAQDHKAAGYVLSQMTDRTEDASAGPAGRPTAIPPPALRACLTGPASERSAAIPDARLRKQDLPG
jgi:TPR repeat protein